MSFTRKIIPSFDSDFAVKSLELSFKKGISSIQSKPNSTSKCDLTQNSISFVN